MSDVQKNAGVTETMRAEILDEARQQARRKLESARQTAREVEAETAQTAQALTEKGMEEARKRADWVRRTTLASVESKVRREMLKGREAVIRRVCQDALERMKKMDANQADRTIAALIVEACAQMEGASFFVQVKQEQREMLTEEFFKRVSGEMARKHGRKIELHAGKMIESRTVTGGVIVTDSECRQTVDNTYEGILAREMGTLRVTLAKELFGTE